jgi:histidine triad (HIT) family protein
MTLFEQIINREVPAQIIHEDDQCVAFRDINPQAPIHVLVIPKKAIPRLGEATDSDETLLGHLLLTAAEVAKREGIAENGYRLVVNQGWHAGESVPHLHVHVLGGRQMKWPPG